MSTAFVQYSMQNYAPSLDNNAVNQKLKKVKEDLVSKINNKGDKTKLLELEKSLSKLSNRVSDKCATKEELKEYVKI